MSPIHKPRPCTPDIDLGISRPGSTSAAFLKSCKLRTLDQTISRLSTPLFHRPSDACERANLTPTRRPPLSQLTPIGWVFDSRKLLSNHSKCPGHCMISAIVYLWVLPLMNNVAAQGAGPRLPYRLFALTRSQFWGWLQRNFFSFLNTHYHNRNT